MYVCAHHVVDIILIIIQDEGIRSRRDREQKKSGTMCRVPHYVLLNNYYGRLTRLM